MKCQMCGTTVHAENLNDCQYVALGEPCCSLQCHRAAYALDRFDKGVVVMPYKDSRQAELPLFYESEPFPESC